MNMSLAAVAYRMATEETFLQAVQSWAKTGAQSELESLAIEDQSALKEMIANDMGLEPLFTVSWDPTSQDSGWWRP